MLIVSSRLGPYEIVAPLGAGGMGEVYRARDTRLGREVAVKVLPKPFANDPDRLLRFEREARAVAALSHPNILAIHDYGTHEAITYAVMELLEGETLRSRIAQGPLPWRETVEVGAAIAEGLAAAHTKGIIHRDLKPENLFLTADGRVKILDFGLARVTTLANTQGETSPYVPAETETGMVMGTVGYMSPEQVRGQTADARSDLFSLGCVLYEMVTGRRAFQRDTAAETMTAILHDEPVDPTASGVQLSPELGRLIRQCLAKSPNARLQSARDLALGLRATATDPALHQSPVTRRFSMRRVGILAAVLLVVATAASVYLLTRNTHPSDLGSPSPAAKAIESLAVLPFENVGGDPETEHLSDGIPESIIRNLYEVRSLKVRPFSSVSRFKGRQKDLDLQEVGRQLNVQAVLTGKLTQRKGALALSVELADVRDMRGIWIGQYDRSQTDIQLMQEEIAKQICVKLDLQLTGEEQKRLTKRYTENPEAFQLYLKGRYFWNKWTPEHINKARSYFEQAIEKDPGFALAYVGLADCYATPPNPLPPREKMPKARAAVTKALELDDTLAEAHATLARVLMIYDWNLSGAKKEFERAIELNPRYAMAHQWYGGYWQAMGRNDQSIGERKRALELDPLSLFINIGLANAFYHAGQYDQAIEQFKKTLEMDPDFPPALAMLPAAYAQKEMHTEAITGFQKAIKLTKGFDWALSMAGLGHVYAVSGKKTEARKVIDELKQMSGQQYVPAHEIALIYAGLGEKEEAFAWLEKAYEERAYLMVFLKSDPKWQSLRSDQRFANLLLRMGLADKASGWDKSTRSAAVLPFVNVGGDPKSEFLSDGVADQIINNLSQVRRQDLKVRPFTSVARYKGKEPDIPSFGRELNVQMIVTGRLQLAGDDLIIQVSVVDVNEDIQLWGNTYRGKRVAILDLQDQIARDVAVHLRLRLTGEEEQRLTKRYTADPEAYLLYSKAQYHWNKFTLDGIRTGIEYFQRAVKKDPNYALAYVGLGRSYNLLGSLYLGQRQTHADAKANLTRALEIDNSLLEAHSGLGMTAMFHDWDWPKAERHLQQAFDLNSSTPAENWYGFYLAAVGRPREALVYIRRNQEVDPLAARNRNELAQCYNWIQQYERAIAEAQKALELDPDFPLAYAELGTAYVLTGKYEEAIARLNQGLDRGQKHPRVLGTLAFAYAAAGEKVAARKVLIELKQHAQVRYGFALSIARTYAGLGENDEAFEWLQKSCDERDPQVIWLKVDATLDNLRSDPRFAQLLQDMGLPP